jgi:hypothetical protein
MCFCAFDACSFRSSHPMRAVEGPAMNELTMQPHRTVRLPNFGHPCGDPIRNFGSSSRLSWATKEPSLRLLACKE